jgi:hypothetical protein
VLDKNDRLSAKICVLYTFSAAGQLISGKVEGQLLLSAGEKNHESMGVVPAVSTKE